MQGKATIAGHPIHPPLVAIPIGCFAAAAIGDVVSIWTNHGFLAVMGTWLIGFGVAGSIFAALFGFVDFVSAPMTMRAKRTASWHALLNVAVIVVFGTALAVRAGFPSSAAGYVLTFVGIAILAVSGWLGGELVSRHLVGSSESDAGAIKTPGGGPPAERKPGRSRIGTA
ncbi:MAG TPA: DUF2231 domain-containing protein [Candidatus Acidoferrales bacterium]|jgi:uncharacterized membrane protein|nr:DUF2231 domain-containing protein [Candidatus Acidoferrales bacterium]